MEKYILRGILFIFALLLVANIAEVIGTAISAQIDVFTSHLIDSVTSMIDTP